MYNPFSLAGKTILVTGASSGIGRAIAIECSKMDARVIITGRNEERLHKVYTELNGTENQYITADLTNNGEVAALVDSIPIIHGVVHSAGILISLPFQFCKSDKVKNVIDTNLMAPIELIYRILKNKKNEKKGCSIVFISSLGGVIVSAPGLSIYGASKAGLVGLAKGMALDLAPKKIRVNSVLPGMIESPMIDGFSDVVTPEAIELDKKRYPLGRYGKPEEVAHAVIYLLSDASGWMTGSNIIIDGGVSLA
ncbi:MAG: SDR family oxidoreductase [Chitinispirillia bacterium]|nr:SDR family oxidoreductase [Chitinispirillia bacterium]